MNHADKPTRQNQRFFNKVFLHFQDLIREKASQNLINVGKAIVEPLIEEGALDVGSVGEKGFYPKQTSFYVGVDLSLEMLRRVEDRTYYKVCGEATNLPFKGGGFNTILHLYLLHHLAKGSMRASIEAVKRALGEGSSCLKTGGNVIIAETCLPSFLEKMERAFFFVLRALLFFTKQSEIFLYSAETLTQILTECNYREIRTWRISKEEENPWDWVRISIAFPILKIPRWMNPSRSMIFEARN